MNLDVGERLRYGEESECNEQGEGREVQVMFVESELVRSTSAEMGGRISGPRRSTQCSALGGWVCYGCSLPALMHFGLPLVGDVIDERGGGGREGKGREGRRLW